MAEIMHGAVEAGPMLFLLRRKLQFRLDPVDIRIAVGDDLFGRQLRLPWLSEHCLIGSLAAFGCFGGFRSTWLFCTIGPARCGCLPAVPDAKHASKHADHPADCAAQYATDRP